MIKYIAYIFYWTWFIWPIAFVYGFAYGIKETIETKNIDSKGFVVATISLLMILAGVVYGLIS